MLTETTTAQAATTPVAPYTVDTGKGSVNGDVSRQWFARPADQRFNSLDDLYAFKKKIHDESFSLQVRSDGFNFHGPDKLESREDLNRLFVGFAGVEAGADVQRVKDVTPTNWSFRQLCQLAKAPSAFLADQLPSPLVSDILNWRLKHQREADHFKAYGGPEELYAATGPLYGRIPDFEVIDAVRRIAGDGLGGMRWKTPGKLDWSNGTYDPENMGPASDHTFYGSDRDMFVFLVNDRNPIVVGKTANGDDDNMFRGFYIQNSEVGSRSLKLCAFYLRGVCMNRNLWGVENFEEITIRHTSMAIDRWVQQAKPALDSFAQRSDARLIEGVNRAKAAKLVDDDKAALEFLKARNFTQSAAAAVLKIHETEEQKPMRTIWDFAQGITAYARDSRNTDDRLDLEQHAKKLLDKVA